MLRSFIAIGAIVATIVLLALFSSHDEPSRPWVGYAFNEDKKQVLFGLPTVQFDYSTKDECIQDLRWKTRDLGDGEQEKNVPPMPRFGAPSKPFGCAFSSNSFLKTYFFNLVLGGAELQFVCEALDPQATHYKNRYQATLRDPKAVGKDSEYICYKLLRLYRGA